MDLVTSICIHLPPHLLTPQPSLYYLLTLSKSLPLPYVSITAEPRKIYHLSALEEKQRSQNQRGRWECHRCYTDPGGLWESSHRRAYMAEAGSGKWTGLIEQNGRGSIQAGHHGPAPEKAGRSYQGPEVTVGHSLSSRTRSCHACCQGTLLRAVRGTAQAIEAQSSVSWSDTFHLTHCFKTPPLPLFKPLTVPHCYPPEW